MKACSRPDFWVPGCSVRRPHHPLGLRRHSSQLAQGESPDAGAARAGPGLHLRTQVWGARSVAAAESRSGLGWRVSALRLLSENITVGGERPRASLLSVPGAGSPRSRQVWCLARAAFWLLEGRVPALSPYAGTSGGGVGGLLYEGANPAHLDASGACLPLSWLMLSFW